MLILGINNFTFLIFGIEKGFIESGNIIMHHNYHNYQKQEG